MQSSRDSLGKAPFFGLIPIPQGGKRNPNPNFLVRIFSSGVWGLPRERVGAKKFATSLETREIKLFGRDIPGLCRDIPGAPEKFEKKKFGTHISFPNTMSSRGFGKGGFQKGGFWQMFPCTEVPSRSLSLQCYAGRRKL